jgi:hypothetical protein
MIVRNIGTRPFLNQSSFFTRTDQCQYLFAFFKAKMKKKSKTGVPRRTLVDLDMDPAEIMDARMDIEASQMRQEPILHLPQGLGLLG